MQARYSRDWPARPKRHMDEQKCSARRKGADCCTLLLSLQRACDGYDRLMCRQVDIQGGLEYKRGLGSGLQVRGARATVLQYSRPTK